MKAAGAGQNRPLTVAWFSFFPIEWLDDLPAELRGLPKMHPATWQRVLLEEFQKVEGLRLEILALRGQFPRSMTFERGNARFHCIRTPPGTRAATLYWMDTLLVRRALRRIQPDLGHAWGTEFGSAAVAGRLKLPSLVTMQGIMTWLGDVFPLNRHQKISRLLEPSSLRRARFVSCESSFAMKYLTERYPHLKLMQIEHAPNPLFSSLIRKPLEGRVRFVCVGPFTHAKGAPVVIKALNGFGRDFELVWIGPRNAELESRLRSETKPQLWKTITFKNDLTPREVADELAAGTVFIHATLADNSPNSVKEAAVAGIPVVASRVGGVPDYITPGENGFLFEPGSVEDCRAKLDITVSHPAMSRGCVEEQPLRAVREYLSAETMARKFLEAYRTVLDGYAKLGSR